MAKARKTRAERKKEMTRIICLTVVVVMTIGIVVAAILGNL